MEITANIDVSIDRVEDAVAAVLTDSNPCTGLKSSTAGDVDKSVSPPGPISAGTRAEPVVRLNKRTGTGDVHGSNTRVAVGFVVSTERELVRVHDFEYATIGDCQVSSAAFADHNARSTRRILPQFRACSINRDISGRSGINAHAEPPRVVHLAAVANVNIRSRSALPTNQRVATDTDGVIVYAASSNVQIRGCSSSTGVTAHRQPSVYVHRRIRDVDGSV